MFDKILNDCEFVIDNSKNVKINYKKLDDFIDKIDCSNLKNWLSNNPYNLLDLNIKDIINFLLFFESIDYSFWGVPKWSINTPMGLKDGSDALLYVLLKYYKENKLDGFINLSINEFKEILNGNVEIPLLNKRYETFCEIANIVQNEMSGDFYNQIKAITNDIDLFNFIINNFPSFKDERVYKGRTIRFYKLAQLLVSDILHLREKIENINVDYSNILGCADYKIPQTLRALGIIEYSRELENLVDNKHELEINSEYEIEIRASVIVVINYIKTKLNEKAIDINDYLYLYSKNVKEIAKPYHLCRNTNY